MKDVYLDAAATAKYSNVDDIVIINAMTNAMRMMWQNPSSLYNSIVKKEIEKCRANIAKFIGAKPEEIIFTSGASESNNMAIRGWCDEVCGMPYIVSTRIEHNSILNIIEDSNISMIRKYCDIDKFGFIEYESLINKLAVNPPVNMYDCDFILVSIGLANNEIGTIQSIKEISDLVHEYNGVLHVDATQALGHIPINVNDMGIDMMSCSGHKISTVLRGIGFLYKRNGVNIQPLIFGSQENGLRGGTENTYGIIGLNKALKYCDISQNKIDELCNKRDYFIDLLESNFGCKLNGHRENRLPNNINVTFPQNITGESLLYVLNMAGVQMSTGSACNSKNISPSHVLKAIGLSDEEAMRAVRFTLPTDITYEEIDYVVEEINKAIKIIEV